MRLKKYLPLFIITGVFWGNTILPVSAAETDQIIKNTGEIDVRVGINNFEKNAFYCLPVLVELRNRTAREFNLNCELRAIDPSNNNKIFLKIIKKEYLPPEGQKRIFFYLPLQGIQNTYFQPELILSDSKNKIIFHEKIAPHDNNDNSYDRSLNYLILNQTSSTTRIDLPEKINAPQNPTWFKNDSYRSKEFTINKLYLSPRDVPDRWYGLADAQIVLLNDTPLNELTPEQIKSLRDWVYRGGVIIISPGTNPAWLNHPFIQELFPHQVQSVKEISQLPALAKFGSFKTTDNFLYYQIPSSPPGYSIMLGNKTSPQLLKKSYGNGLVYLLPFNISRPPFNVWSGQSAFWEYLINDAAASLPSWHEIANVKLLKNITSLLTPHPPFLLLVALTVLFILIVGPINYLVLNRYRLTILNVATIPLISICFTFFIISIGYLFRGVFVKSASFVYLNTYAGDRVARAERLSAVRSPRSTTYDIQLDKTTFGGIGAIENKSSYSRRSSYNKENQSIIYQYSRIEETGTEQNIRGQPIAQWANAFITGESFQELGGGITFKVDKTSVEISNASPFRIKKGIFINGTVPVSGVTNDPLIITGGVPFGAVETGQQITVPLSEKISILEALSVKYQSNEFYWLELFGATTWENKPSLLCLIEKQTSNLKINGSVFQPNDELIILEVRER
mgnify:CR=1 FL=1